MLVFLLAATSAVLAFSGAAPANATVTSAVANDTTKTATTIVYTGELTEQQLTQAGDPDSDRWTPKVSSIDRLGITCVEGDCKLFGVVPTNYRGTIAPDISIALTDGHADVMQPDNPDGDPCEPRDKPGTMTIDATRFDITVVWVTESFECSPDPIEPSANVLGLRQTWTGTYVEGDRCLVDRSDCPQASQTATSKPDSNSSGSNSGRPTTTPTTNGPATAWSSPSTLSSLVPISIADDWVPRLCLTAAVVIILVLLIAFPTALLNSAIERATTSRIRPRRPAAHLSGWWQAGLGVLAAAIISGFINPDFGINAESVRVVASLLIAFTVDVILGWSALIWVVRRSNPSVTAHLTFKPLTLLIVIGAVALTRLSEFEPGIVFGIVAGVVFSAAVTASHRAPAELVALGYAFLVAMLAWVGYTAMLIEGSDATDEGSMFVKETFASFAIAGVAALPIVLVPLRGLPGHPIYQWHRSVWGAAYFAALFAFFLMLMPLPLAWLEVPLPLKTWVAIYLMYAVGAVATWAIVRLLIPDPSTPAAMSDARRPSR